MELAEEERARIFCGDKLNFLGDGDFERDLDLEREGEVSARLLSREIERSFESPLLRYPLRLKRSVNLKNKKKN